MYSDVVVFKKQHHEREAEMASSTGADGAVGGATLRGQQLSAAQRNSIARAMDELERHTDDPRMATLHRVLNAARNPTDFSEEESNDLIDRSEDDETLAPVVTKAVKLSKTDRLADSLVAVKKAEADVASEMTAEDWHKERQATRKAQESYLAEVSPGFARMRQLEHDRRAFVQRSTG